MKRANGRRRREVRRTVDNGHDVGHDRRRPAADTILETWHNPRPPAARPLRSRLQDTARARRKASGAGRGAADLRLFFLRFMLFMAAVVILLLAFFVLFLLYL